MAIVWERRAVTAAQVRQELGQSLTNATVRTLLRRLEAMLLVADHETTLVITGNGDVLEPNDGIGAIGSGGTYAQSAAKALQENTDLSPLEIVKKSLTIAGELCIYTNLSHTIETLD